MDDPVLGAEEAEFEAFVVVDLTTFAGVCLFFEAVGKGLPAKDIFPRKKTAAFQL